MLRKTARAIYGLAIGPAIFVGATVVGVNSGRAFNPAAAIAAALVFKVANPTNV